MSTSKRTGTEQRVKLTDEQVHLIAKALSDPRRYELLRQIGSSETSTPCTAIQEMHPVSAPTLSHHMKELETAGLVRAKREGKFVSYTLRRDILQAYTDALTEI
jgi:ArsR family transcriptional regulator, arsenate/arsenite/antimonite-responsive transcriptional repressor